MSISCQTTNTHNRKHKRIQFKVRIACFVTFLQDLEGRLNAIVNAKKCFSIPSCLMVKWNDVRPAILS